MIDIKVPTVGESINEVTLLKRLKKDGDYVDRDEVIAELESEKATFEVNAEQAGVVTFSGLFKEGDTLKIGDILATIDDTVAKPVRASTPAPPAEPVAKEPASPQRQTSKPLPERKVTPVASAMLADKNLDPAKVVPTGPGGKILKDDVKAALDHPGVPYGRKLFDRSEKREKMSNLRKTISRRLVEAK
ncbi:MAG: biotin/lipoyl-containing protein, partial [Chitinophagaceae bacterium]